VILNERLDLILKTYSVGPYYDEIRGAKEDFFNRVGNVAEGTDAFEPFMNSFIDWYLFERPLNELKVTPVQAYYEGPAQSLPEDEREVFRHLTQSLHSIYELKGIRGQDVTILDLYSGKKYFVEESEVHHGFSKGSLFEARIIQLGDRYVFGRSFHFHPHKVASFIRDKVNQTRSLDPSQQRRLLYSLASMKNKIEQYPHLDVSHIYSEKPLF
jgi:hypothetical protein